MIYLLILHQNLDHMLSVATQNMKNLLFPIIENVDLLYHEATFLENKRERAKKTFHSTAIDAAKIAKLSNAKKLLLGHYSARYNDLSEFEKEANSIFKNVIAVKDGDTFEIELINEE